MCIFGGVRFVINFIPYFTLFLGLADTKPQNENYEGGLELFYCIGNHNCFYSSFRMFAFIIFRKITIQIWCDVKCIIGLCFENLCKKYIK